MIDSGEANFGSVVACAEAASYRLIAPELFAHMSLYSSSVSAMAGRLIPNRLVANNCASRVLLALTEATGTTDERAELKAAMASCAATAICWHCCAVVRNQLR